MLEVVSPISVEQPKTAIQISGDGEFWESCHLFLEIISEIKE